MLGFAPLSALALSDKPSTGGVTLNVLTMSPTSVAESASAQIVSAIGGTTVGSTVTVSNATQFYVSAVGDDWSLYINPTDYEVTSSYNINLIETLGGAGGSPKSTPFTITITDVLEPLKAKRASFWYF